MRPGGGAACVGAGGLAAVAVAYAFARYGYGLFLPELREAFDLSTEMLGLIAAGSYGGYLCALVVTGFTAARYGARAPVVAGGALAGAGMVLIAVTDDVRVLAVGVMMAGASAGCTWAPFSDVVAHVVRPALRRRTLAVISTGTSFGLLVAAPAALLAGAAWRHAWAAFAAVALAVAAYNLVTLPRGPLARAEAATARLDLRWFAAVGAGRLVAVTLAMSVSGSVYWTYAVDLVHDHGLAAVAGPLLWGVVGLAGVSGVAAGDASARFGVGRCLALLQVTLAAGIGVVALAPSSAGWVVASAALFGVAFMSLAALIAILGSRVYPSRPSVGFTSTVLVMALGAIAGPVGAGMLAGSIGMRPTFGAAAAVALIGAVPALAPARRGGRGGAVRASDPLA